MFEEWDAFARRCAELKAARRAALDEVVRQQERR
eukprot:gene16493-53031_t